MAGQDPTGSFNSTAFRSGIRTAMTMGIPNATGDTPTFRWVVKDQFAVGDAGDRPYNWFTAPQSGSVTSVPDVQVPCAVEFMGGGSSGTDAGFINELVVRITVLDEDQQTLIANGGRMPDQVLIHDDIYNVDYVQVQGLFDVDVWMIYASAQDAT